MGVRELRVPARALSISSSAMQNKYAGSRLPSTPDKKIIDNFFAGTCLKFFIAMGNKTRPEEIIRSDAT